MTEPAVDQTKAEETGIVYFVFLKTTSDIRFNGILSFVFDGQNYTPYVQKTPWSERRYLDDCAASGMSKAFAQASGKLGDERKSVMANPRQALSITEFRTQLWYMFVAVVLEKLQWKDEILKEARDAAKKNDLTRKETLAYMGLAGLYHFPVSMPSHNALDFLLNWENGYMTWLKIMLDDLKPPCEVREGQEE